MSDQIKGWHEDRLTAATELRKVVEDVKSGAMEMDAETRAKLDTLNTVIDNTQANIDAVRRAEAATAQIEVARSEYERVVSPAVLDRHDADQDAQIMAFLRGENRSRTFDLDLRQVAREAQLIQQDRTREFRDLVKVTAAAGGTLVPTTMLRQLYVYLQDYAAIRQTNVRVITTTSGENLDMPTVATYGTAAIVGEGSALAEADATFSKVTLGAWKYGQLVQISSELLADSAVDALSFIGEDFGRSLGIVTGNAYLNGTGSSQPTGVLVAYATGVTGQTLATGVPSYKNLVDMVYSVASPYRSRGAYWMFRDSGVGAIRGITDTTGRPLWEPSSQVGAPDRLLGFPVIADPAVAALATGIVSGVFGDFSGFAIRDVGTIRIERSDEFAFSADLVTFRAALRTDSKVLDAGSLRVYRGGTA